MSHAGFDKLYVYAEGKCYEFMPTAEGQSTGNYQLSVAGNKYVWTGFTAVGLLLQSSTDKLNMHLNEVSIDELTKRPAGFKINYPVDSKFLDTVPNRDYSITRYRKSFHLFNFHSWLPTIDDPEYTISLIGENVLNTYQSELYFQYNINERSKKIGYAGTYGAWFPWLRIGGAFTKDRSALFKTNTVYWNEAEGSIGLAVPLNFTNGKHYTNLLIGTDFIYNKPSFQQPYKDTFDDSGFGYVKASLSFTNQIQRARQHIFPRFAQTIRLDYNNSVVNAEGYQATASATLYFPGLFPTHNLVINTAIHNRDTLNQVRFSNTFPFSRGYQAYNFHQMGKLGVNYHLPLLYPDWGFASIVYFLRIRANAFYDYTEIMDFDNAREKVNLHFRSYGGEIFFDTKWWNQHPVSFGFRYSRLLDADVVGQSPNQWEFILPVNLTGR